MSSSRGRAVVVGGGIIGLAHAHFLAEAGFQVKLLEKHSRPVGASVRNFGLITVTGQREGEYWELAMESRGLWSEIGERVGINFLQRGTLVKAQRPAAMAVLEEFAGTGMGEECRLLDRARLEQEFPVLAAGEAQGAMISPHELRVDPRDVSRRLHGWLSERNGIEIVCGETVVGLEQGRAIGRRCVHEADLIVCCLGTGVGRLFPDYADRDRIRFTKLHMARIELPGLDRLPHALMSDPTMVFYEGFSLRPSAASLREAMERECPAALELKVNTLVTQQEDGSLIIGDSHHYLDAPDCFFDSDVEDVIVDQIGRILPLEGMRVRERWIGFYPYSEERRVDFREAAPGVHVATVNRGKGMTICWAWAKRNIDGLVS